MVRETSRGTKGEKEPVFRDGARVADSRRLDYKGRAS